MLTLKRALWLAAFLSMLYLLQARLSHQPVKEKTLKKHLSLLFPYDSTSDLPRHIWQIWFSPSHEEFLSGFRVAESSWTTINPDFEHEVVTDEAAPVSQPTLTVTTEAKTEAVSTEFDVPFLSQATFRALILASPILHTFFEQDLPTSFVLQPVERHTSTREAFMSALNDARSAGSPSRTRQRPSIATARASISSSPCRAAASRIHASRLRQAR